MTEEIKEPEVKTEEPKEKDPLNEIVSRLDEYGITSIEQLENKVKAASESGRLANMVGELRKKIESLESTPKQPEYSYDESGVDIDAAIGNAVTKALDRRERAAREAHMARIKEIQTLRSDGDYKLIGDKFERFMNTPDAHIALQNGETPSSIYNKMVRLEYRNMLVQMKDSVSKRAGNPSQTAVPHMETDQTAPPASSPVDDKKNKIKDLKKNWRGTDEEHRAMLDAILTDIPH